MYTRRCTLKDERRKTRRFRSSSQDRVHFVRRVRWKSGPTTSAVMLTLLLFFEAATAQLSTRNTSPSAELPSRNGNSGEAILDRDEIVNMAGPQVLLQLEQLFAELERLNAENKRLKGQLELTVGMQEELEALRSENVLMKEQLGEARTSQQSDSVALPFQNNEAAWPEAQMQNQDLVAVQNQPQQTREGQVNQGPELVSEISALQRQVQRINDEHAMLREQLSSTLVATEGQPTEQQTHIVQPGDSLSKLAKAYYGTGSLWPEILAANLSVTDSNQLIVGTTLVIP